MDKHTFWHNLRTIASGLLVIGLIPLPFIFMGSNESGSVNLYFVYLVVCTAVLIISQIMVTRYKAYADTSAVKKQTERLYSYIGIGLILLFIAGFMLMPTLANLFD